MEGSFKIDFGNLKVDQLGFVFKDIEKQAKIMESVLGLSKFIFTPEGPLPMEYRGKETRVIARIGVGRIGNTQIELIQWREGDCDYKDFLDAGKEGLHHVGIYVDDADSYITEFEKQGIKILQQGQIMNLRFVYLDTEEKFGFIIELLQTVKRRKRKK